MKTVVYYILLIITTVASGQSIDHSIFDKVLSKHVSSTGSVNYKALSQNPDQLIEYLNLLVRKQPDESWSKDETLTYWINAYNAYTLKLIIDHFPIASIKDIKQPWDQEFIPYQGKMISLNTVEHSILRKMNEPRIHFAIVCASFSCPKLQNKAFTANRLNEQLNSVTRNFLLDESRNSISPNSLKLSKIFKWFSKDFEQNGSVIDFINTYASLKISTNAEIDYLDYNWSLND